MRDWGRILERTRAYEGIDDGAPVPVPAVHEQALAQEGNARRSPGAEERARKRISKQMREAPLRAVDGYDDPLHVVYDESAARDDDHGESDTQDEPEIDRRAHGALAEAVSYMQDQLDTATVDSVPVTEDDNLDDLDGGRLTRGEDAELQRKRTAREYLREERGWSDDLIDNAGIGWAPPSEEALVSCLMSQGYGRQEMLGTGLFWDNLSPIWKGRFVFPYFNKDSQVVFAISRRLDPADSETGGHEADDAGVYAEDDNPAKYHKIPDTDHAVVEEPIYGLDTLRDRDGPVLVTEGIADAAAAHEAGYAAISPVTTSFSHAQRQRVRELLAGRGERVVIANDAEDPSFELTQTETLEGWDRLVTPELEPGLSGALATAASLRGHDQNNVEDDAVVSDVHVARIPRCGLSKVDVDDILTYWGTMDAVVASAKPVEQLREFNPDDYRSRASTTDENPEKPTYDGDGQDRAALYELSITDVTGLSADARTCHPDNHRGDSQDYFVVGSDGETATDFKTRDNVTYNALTYLVCLARREWESPPRGNLDDEEIFLAWKAARDTNVLRGDKAPYAAVRHAARQVTDGEPSRDDSLPAPVYNAAIEWLRKEVGDPGREPVNGHESDENEGPDPRTLDIIVRPAVAHRAAELVRPEDLSEEAACQLPFGAAPDADCWTVEGSEVGLIRAVAMAEGLVSSVDESLPADSYGRAYQRARAQYGAPLPEYITREDSVSAPEAAFAAANRCEWLDLDVVNSKIMDDDPADCFAELDPCWRDSDSGRSVRVLDRRGPADTLTIYDHDTGRALGIVRYVALEAEIILHPNEPLQGSDWVEAYRETRRRGAPLPEWFGADNPGAIAWLPEAGDALGGDLRDEERLSELRQDTEELYRDLAGKPGDAGRVDVLDVLPALGKTTSATIAADEHPMSYFAARKQLQADMRERADEWDRKAVIEPVLRHNVPLWDRTVDAAVRGIRQNGQQLLRDASGLVDAAKAVLDVDELTLSERGFLDAWGAETVDELDRPSCPTASGAYGPEWALRVNVARALGYTPAEIHRDDQQIFGETLPCQDREVEPATPMREVEEDGEAKLLELKDWTHDHNHNSDTCPYTARHDYINDPANDWEIVIGDYSHAYVDGAVTRTFNRDEMVRHEPRTVVVDEFPGVEQFGSVVDGEDMRASAAWLADALLTRHIDGVTDLWAGDWHDQTVTAWLNGNGHEIEELGTARSRAHYAASVLRLAKEADSIPRDAVEIPSSFANGLDRAAKLDVDAPPEAIAGAIRQLDHGIADMEREQGSVSYTFQPVMQALADLEDASADAQTDYDAEGLLAGLDVDLVGDMAGLLDAARDASMSGNRDRAIATLSAYHDALAGGPEGCRALARHADDGWADPDAWLHLAGVLAQRADDTTRIETETLDLNESRLRGDGSVVNQLNLGRRTVVIDSNLDAALLHRPPAFRAATGEDCQVVGLDATARGILWGIALGRDAELHDICDSLAERREILREVLNLSVIQSSRTVRGLSGARDRSYDREAALIEEVAQQYTGHALDSRRDIADREERAWESETADKPAVLTTKPAESELEELVGDQVSAFRHYGDITGGNIDELESAALSLVIGSRHYGDQAPELAAVLAGQEPSRTGRGSRLDYGCEAANAMLAHMRYDETMQAVLRFARDERGATVIVDTCCIRDDLPVDGQARVARTRSENERRIVEACRDLQSGTESWTRKDVEEWIAGRYGGDAVPSSETVRRHLSEAVSDGLLLQVEAQPGVATEFGGDEQLNQARQHGEAEVDLLFPDVASAETAGVEEATSTCPVHNLYTGVVGVNREEATIVRADPTLTGPNELGEPTPPG